MPSYKTMLCRLTHHILCWHGKKRTGQRWDRWPTQLEEVVQMVPPAFTDKPNPASVFSGPGGKQSTLSLQVGSAAYVRCWGVADTA